MYDTTVHTIVYKVRNMRSFYLSSPYTQYKCCNKTDRYRWLQTMYNTLMLLLLHSKLCVQCVHNTHCTRIYLVPEQQQFELRQNIARSAISNWFRVGELRPAKPSLCCTASQNKLQRVSIASGIHYAFIDMPEYFTCSSSSRSNINSGAFIKPTHTERSNIVQTARNSNSPTIAQSYYTWSVSRKTGKWGLNKTD